VTRFFGLKKRRKMGSPPYLKGGDRRKKTQKLLLPKKEEIAYGMRTNPRLHKGCNRKTHPATAEKAHRQVRQATTEEEL